MLQAGKITALYCRLSQEDMQAGRVRASKINAKCSAGMCGNRAGIYTIHTVMTGFRAQRSTILHFSG